MDYSLHHLAGVLAYRSLIHGALRRSTCGTILLPPLTLSRADVPNFLNLERLNVLERHVNTFRQFTNAER